MQALLSSWRPLADTMANIPMAIATAYAALDNWPNTRDPQCVLLWFKNWHIYIKIALVSGHLTPPPLCLLSISGCYGYLCIYIY